MSSNCILCVSGFDIKKDLENHLIIQHGNKQTFSIFNWQETSEGRRESPKNSGNNDKIDKEIENKTGYKCYVCGQSFSKYSAAKHHMIYMHNNEKEQVDNFNSKEEHPGMKPATSKSSIFNWQETSEGRRESPKNSGNNDKIDKEIENKTGYRCYVCGQSFSKYSAAKRHMILHNNEKEQVDNFNSKKEHQGMKPATSKSNKEPQKASANTNKIDIKEEDNTPYKCDKCGESFSTFFAAKDHVSCLLPFKCKECGKRFQGPAALSTHSRIHTGQKTYNCEECGKHFRGPSALAHHSTIHTGERPFKCPVCDKSFRHAWTLKTHILIHTGEKPHKCELCGKSFRQAANLREHLVIHTGEKPHECEVCGKFFRKAANLRTHSLMHTGEKPHKCEVCGKSFRWSSNLKTHSMIHSSENPHKCEVCDKSFTSASTLKLHSMKHTGEKPHICVVCNKSFARASNLRLHSTMHTGEKPYICDQCGQSFRDVSNLQKHLKAHHGENSQC